MTNWINSLLIDPEGQNDPDLNGPAANIDWDVLKTTVTLKCRQLGFQSVAILDSLSAAVQKKNVEFDVVWNGNGMFSKIFPKLYLIFY